MRHATAVVCLLAAACTSENELRYTSTLQAETNGVVLSDDGLDGHAAMVGTTCTIDVNWGCPVADADLPTPAEALVDHYHGKTLGTSDEGAHTIETDGQYAPAEDILLPGVMTGRMFRDGTVLVGGDSSSCWVKRGETQLELPPEACADGAVYSVDREDGTLFVAGAGALLAAGPDGVRELPGEAGLVSWDPANQQLLVADEGDTTVSALDREGRTRWTEEVGGPVHQLAARGDRGEVLVLVEREDGFATVERRSGGGRLLGRSTLPGFDGELVVSANGARIAIVRPDEVDFFALETDGEEPVVDETPPECIDPITRETRD